MVIRPRTLEEIAQEQASAEPLAPQARPSSPVAANKPTHPDTPTPPTRSSRPTAPVKTPIGATTPASSARSPSQEDGEELWDPFAEDEPAAGALQDHDTDAPRRRTPDLWKPAEEPRDLRTRLRPWGIALTAMGITLFGVWFAFHLSDLSSSAPAQRVTNAVTQWMAPPQPMRVAVVLINECPFSEKAFMAKVMPDGPTAEFIDGKATLEALPNQRIKLIANTKYPQFHYDSGSFPVGPEVRLTGNCDNMEERAKAISESLRDAFKK
ncbi:MAG: hypothetical protein RL397_1277 [Pseudomonadota bacterium]